MTDPASQIEVSVVLPCLNEAKTLAECIQSAHQAFKDSGIKGEVVISDNGSTDGSSEIAKREGARVVPVRVKGYGNALHAGFTSARGRYIVFLDADMSYDFAHIPRFVEKLREGADLVMGSRFKGTIYPGAMPFLHRYLGTPVLTRLANLFYGCGISDINCGMRGLSKDAFKRMKLRSGGMEFASEIIIKAALMEMKIVETPTDLRPDKRGRAPHLRTFQDGWRHLRFMLLFCPTWLFLVPGLSMLAAGLVIIVAVLFDISPWVGLFTCFIGLSMTVLGGQVTMLGLVTREFAQFKQLDVREHSIGRFMKWLTLEKGIAIGLLVGLCGIALLGFSLIEIIRFMNMPGYRPGIFNPEATKLALLGTTMFVIGTETFFSSFFLGLFRIEPLQTE